MVGSNNIYGSVMTGLSERVSDSFWKTEDLANGLEELITCKGFCKEVDSVNREIRDR